MNNNQAYFLIFICIIMKGIPNVNMIIFSFNDSNILSLPTQYPAQLALSRNDMINNVIKFHILKIKLDNDNKLMFDIYDKKTYFSFRVNILRIIIYIHINLLIKCFILFHTQNKTFMLIMSI